MGQDCSTQWNPAPEGFEASTTCEMRGGGAHARTSYVGDFDADYVFASDIHVEFESGPAHDFLSVGHARWASACPRGMGDGDAVKTPEPGVGE